MQNIHPLAAITTQSYQYFAMTLGEQIFEFKNGDSTFENPRSYAAIVISEACLITPGIDLS